MNQIRIFDVLLNYASFVLLCSLIEFWWNMLFNLLKVIKNFDSVTSIGIFSWFDYPPRVLCMTFEKFLEFFMLKHIFAIHFFLKFNNISLRHNFPWTFPSDIVCVINHVPVQLAFCRELIYSVNVIINLMRHQFFYDFDTSYLSIH